MVFRRFFITAFLVLFLSGCAATRTSNNQTQQLQNQVKQLQNRIDSLEGELQNKDEEISYLERELAKLQSAKQKAQKSATATTTTKLSIKQTQTALKNAGFYKGPIDGKSGPQTQEAIKAFQKAKGIKADGVVGKQTIEKLNSYLP